jgi:hypothetical protein
MKGGEVEPFPRPEGSGAERDRAIAAQPARLVVALRPDVMGDDLVMACFAADDVDGGRIPHRHGG